MMLVDQITADMKAAMRDKDAIRLMTIRLLKSEILLLSKESKDAVVTDEQAIACVEKLIKQRRESARQFRAADREDLAVKEDQEAEILKVYMPEPLNEASIHQLIDQAFCELKPEGIRDMGKVVSHLKNQLAGRADMAQVSQIVKARLA
jgi:uncharacterized protein YqeY